MGRRLWSIKRTDHGKDAIVEQFVFPFLAQAIFREIAARVVSLQSIEHFDVISMINEKNCCRFVDEVKTLQRNHSPAALGSS